MNTELLWHTDTLTHFNAILYNEVLNYNHVVSKEVAKKYNDIQYFGYEVEKENKETHQVDRYFLRTEYITKLPIKVTKNTKFAHQSQVFRYVNACESVKIPEQKMMEFSQLVDEFAKYDNSEPKYWRLAKIILLAAECERLNIRIVSEASFGKDAITDILGLLQGDVANLYNATLGKLKYALKNRLIILNELGGLKTEEIGALQVYLTQAGAYKPNYENNSRKVQGTKETMDISKVSHVVFHNTKQYYETKSQKYFEQMFTPAIMDRFPALLMKGYVTTDFSGHPNFAELLINGEALIKDIISTINYYKNNSDTIKAKYKIDDDFWGFKGKEKQRSLRSFKIISKYLSLAAKDENQFQEDCELLKKCKDDYKEKELNVYEEDVE